MRHTLTQVMILIWINCKVDKCGWQLNGQCKVTYNALGTFDWLISHLPLFLYRPVDPVTIPRVRSLKHHLEHAQQYALLQVILSTDIPYSLEEVRKDTLNNCDVQVWCNVFDCPHPYLPIPQNKIPFRRTPLLENRYTPIFTAKIKHFSAAPTSRSKK